MRTKCIARLMLNINHGNDFRGTVTVTAMVTVTVTAMVTVTVTPDA
jgi:hypothetical protein